MKKALLTICIILLSSVCYAGEHAVIFFHAKWCRPCQAMKARWNDKKVRDAISLQQYDEYLVDYDENVELRQKYGVTSVPSFFIVRRKLDNSAEILSQKTGAMSVRELEKWLLEKR